MSCTIDLFHHSARNHPPRPERLNQTEVGALDPLPTQSFQVGNPLAIRIARRYGDAELNRGACANDISSNPDQFFTM